MDALESLQLQLRVAWRAVGDIQARIEAFRNARTTAFEAQLSQEIADTFGDEFRAALEARDQARVAELAERDRLARTATDTPYPVGTVLVEWRRPRLEVITTDSQHPGKGYRAEVGTIVIRLLKKDGKPGARYAALRE